MTDPASGTRDASRRPRVLVVDEHTDSAEILGLLLRRAGCNAQIVSDPLEALSRALQFQPQVVVIDIGLTRMQGIDLLQAMRAEPTLGPCRFVSVTGYSVDEVERRSAAVGFHAHLTKPIDFAKLYKVMVGELLASGY